MPPDTTEPVQRDARQWTTRRLLGWITGHLESREIEPARVIAEMLIAHVLGCERMRLYMEADRPATPGELTSLRTLVARAAGHVPVQYLLGDAQFYWRSFRVSAATLIPQPSTETLVDFILEQHGREQLATDDAATDADVEGEAGERPGPPLRVADIGTGTGCIAITLAAQLPRAAVIATDTVPETLELARLNAENHRVLDRVDLRHGSLLEPLAGETPFDVICSNPPYIPDTELDQMDRCVREHVPRSAWHGGADGLDVIRPLLKGGPDLLSPGGWLAIEIAHSQRDEVLSIASADERLDGVQILKDQDGFCRVLVARRGEPGRASGSLTA